MAQVKIDFQQNVATKGKIMSNNIPRVRFLINALLNVKKWDGGKEERLFSSGSYYNVKKIHQYPDGYSDIFLSDGGIIEGLKANEITEFHGDFSNVTKHVPLPATLAPPKAVETAKKNLGLDKS